MANTVVCNPRLHTWRLRPVRIKHFDIRSLSSARRANTKWQANVWKGRSYIDYSRSLRNGFSLVGPKEKSVKSTLDTSG